MNQTDAGANDLDNVDARAPYPQGEYNRADRPSHGSPYSQGDCHRVSEAQCAGLCSS
ncbi:MAG: hypothetical protein ACRDQ2_03070 [Gaiellales bacterium]